MSPRALFVTTVPITLEQFLAPFAEHFRERGWTVDAMANGAASNPHIAEAFDARFDVEWSRNPLAPKNLLGTAAKVRRQVADGRYDIVHVHTPIAAFVTRYALRNITGSERPAVIYTAHGFHFYEGGSPLSNAIFRTMERIAARWTDYLVTINQEDYAAARALGTIDAARVRYIPGIGVDTDRYCPTAAGRQQAQAIREELGIPHNAFLLTMLAEYAPVKRHTHVFEALARVKREDVHLAALGHGPLESQLREKMVALGLQDRVRLTGWRRDVPAVLAASDALVLASAREGLPRSVLEGMCAGLAIIGTETRGITDAVGDGAAGWIVAKDDIDALARAIETAATDREETARRGEAARERVVATFSLHAVIEAHEELYAEALASRV